MVPAEDRLSTVSSALSVSAAPAATVTLARSDRRSPLLSVNKPALTCTVRAWASPLRLLLPVTVSVPRPRLASTSALVCSVYWLAVRRCPTPARVPARVKVSTVSSPPSVRVRVSDTVTSAPAARRPALASERLPPATLTVSDPAVPVSVALPATCSVPVPRLASTAAPVLSVVVPAVSVWPLPARVPVSASVLAPCAPASCSVAPLATVMSGLPFRRFTPSSSSVPPVTDTVPAAAVPASVLVPLLVRLPAPSAAPAATVPLSNA